jgi:hypothetical protein
MISRELLFIYRVSGTATYPGIERPGIPTWKSVMLPELICPEILARTLNLASTLPPNTTRRLPMWSILVLGAPSLAHSMRTKIQPKLGDFRGDDCACGDSPNAYGRVDVGVNVEGDGCARSCFSIFYGALDVRVEQIRLA